MLKRWIAVMVPTLTLALTATSASASATHCTSRVPSGKYQTTIDEPVSLQGVWTIDFNDGTDTDYLNGTEVASGTYTISGSTIKFAQPAVPSGSVQTCQTPGTYTFRLPGRTLTFTKISDPCNSVRSEILSHRYFHIR
ncbi:MAG: hypothetical protein ABSA03_17635 [Streptosporangiaceae bacterium]